MTCPEKEQIVSGELSGWSTRQMGRIVEYQKKTVLTGSAENIDLMLGEPARIDRIEFFSNDTTAKSFSLRVFDGSVDTAAYAELLTVASDTNMSIVLQLGVEYQYLHVPIRIRTAVTSSTAAKTLTVKIVIRS